MREVKLPSFHDVPPVGTYFLYCDTWHIMTKDIFKMFRNQPFRMSIYIAEIEEEIMIAALSCVNK